MVEQQVVITNRLGLHARAAAQLVSAANRFNCQTRIERIDGSATADAKSILSVLMLAALRGTELKLIADGVDEKQAIGALTELFADGFGESTP